MPRWMISARAFRRIYIINRWIDILLVRVYQVRIPLRITDTSEERRIGSQAHHIAITLHGSEVCSLGYRIENGIATAGIHA